MTDDDIDPGLEARFKAFDRLDSPDVWSTVAAPLPGRPKGRRRRVLAVAAAVVALVGLGAGWALWPGGDEDDVVAGGGRSSEEHTNEPPVSADAPGVVAPDVVGLGLDVARPLIEQAGLRPAVIEGDPDFGPAVVVAQEPGAGLSVGLDDIIGLRTALPDPPLRLECVGGRHPRDGSGPGDGLPQVDSVSRAGAEQAVIELRSRLSNTIFLGQWSRWAWQRVDGEVEVVPVEGFQVIVVADSGDCGPVTPPTVNGVPVTEVRGPLEDFIAGLEAADQQVETGLGFTVDLPVRWTADPAAATDGWSESVVGDGGGFFRARAMDRPDRSLFVGFADPNLPDLGEAAAEMAGLFPREFGTTPEIVSTTVDARAAYVIIPSADAITAETVTYLFYSPLSSRQFLEVAIDRAHDAAVMATFTWVGDPPVPEPTGASQTVSSDDYGVTFDIPAEWERADDVGGDQWGGADGYVQVSACCSNLSLDEVAALQAGHLLRPYGSEPTIEEITVDDRAGRLIMPSADAPPLSLGLANGTVLAVLTDPIVVGAASYEFVLISADVDHVREIAASIRWRTADHAVTSPSPTAPFTLQTAEDLVVAVSATGIEASSLEDPFLPLGAVVAGRQRRICVAGGLVRVFEFDSVSLRVAESELIRPDGQPSRANVAWVATPRFYASDRLIALHLGDRMETIDALARIMGPTLSPDVITGRGENRSGENCAGELVAIGE